MDFPRAVELTAYSVLRIVPYLLLMFYIFKDRFRFPNWVFFPIAALITALRCLCGYAVYYDPARLTDPNPGIMIFVVLSILLIKDHWGKSLFSMWMLANISSFVVTAAKYFEWILFSDRALELHRWTNTLMLLIMSAVVLIPLFFYIKHVYTKAIHQRISRYTWSLLWLVPFTFYTVWYRNSFFATENHETLSFELIYVFFCLLVNGGGMLIYTLVVHLINERVENDRLREKELQLVLTQKQFDSLQERIEEARTARHDLKQHLHILSALAADKKYGELEAYIHRYSTSVSETSTTVYCKHYGINALLQYFSGLAREHHMGFTAYMELPEEIAIPDEILAVLMGNLLENAFEACTAHPAPLITIRGKMDGNLLFFKVINTYIGQPKRSPDGLYLSTKHEGRGIGLRSVRGIVEDYRGMLEIKQNDGLFTVSVLVKAPMK